MVRLTMLAAVAAPRSAGRSAGLGGYRQQKQQSDGSY
jgi:hypothetical protein